MLKQHRDILKMLTPVAEAAGVAFGDLQVGGKHARLNCTRADGSQFHLTLPLSPSCNRAGKNILRDFRSMLEKKDRKGP